ncbi:unnamed protein product [Moneuplotes crassus]|uniref:Uncharacterized protein n=1 Tax=Euplotes crassus TaxID=5936 RepID=A0AAD1Y1V4_EUPCR|nr:unnamed protein product [Moneuplotes crassus]
MKITKPLINLEKHAPKLIPSNPAQDSRREASNPSRGIRKL